MTKQFLALSQPPPSNAAAPLPPPPFPSSPPPLTPLSAPSVSSALPIAEFLTAICGSQGRSRTLERRTGGEKLIRSAGEERGCSRWGNGVSRGCESRRDGASGEGVQPCCRRACMRASKETRTSRVESRAPLSSAAAGWGRASSTAQVATKRPKVE